MPAIAQPFNDSCRTSLDSAGRRNSDDAQRLLPPLESAELLRGGKTVGIVHNGSLYRLQATKLGKLILTK